MSVYFITCREANAVKIGHSGDPHLRVKDIQTGCPRIQPWEGSSVKSRGAGQTSETERQVQRAALAMIRACFPRVLYHHSAVVKLTGSAQQRGMQMGAMKADGFKVGFPDLLCLWPVRSGCLMEFKRPKGGVVSDAQKEMHAMLEGLGWPVRVIRSVDEAYDFLKELGAPWNGVPYV